MPYLLGEIAQRSGRKICLFGRSLATQHEIATAIGRLAWPSDLLIAPEQARDFPRERLLVLAGGSQAERNSAMNRLALGSHQLLEIEPDDTVVFSSRIIPGNERVVFTMMNDLLRRGARLISRVSEPDVHTSGHAGRSEQAEMISLIRPRAFVPVHGTLHHLTRHAELARELGISDVLVVENGTSFSYHPERGLARGEAVPCGKIAVAIGGERLEPETLKRRADLGRAGVISVSVVIDEEGFVVTGPSVSARGVPGVDDDELALRTIAQEVARALERIRSWHDADEIEEVRRAARRAVALRVGCRPAIEAHVLRLDD